MTVVIIILSDLGGIRKMFLRPFTGLKSLGRRNNCCRVVLPFWWA